MKSLMMSAAILATIVAGCATRKNIEREPQQVGGDVGMKHINVDALSTENAGVGTSMSFGGREAESLYNSLPESLLKENPEKVVGFVARGLVNSVIVRCAKNRFDAERGEYVPFSQGTKCQITLEKTKSRAELLQNKWVQPQQK